jgi:hypothetical protein
VKSQYFVALIGYAVQMRKRGIIHD